MAKALNNEDLEPLIFTVRGRRVIFDADRARLYAATTKALNQAVRRNEDRFPGDFAFQLTPQEFANLRSQFATSSFQPFDNKRQMTNRSQIVTGSHKHRGSQAAPWAFTEHGALMAANILRSDRAVQMSVFVVRAFVRLREQVAANTAVLKHDSALRDVYQKLLPLLQPPADPPKRRIGCHTDND